MKEDQPLRRDECIVAGFKLAKAWGKTNEVTVFLGSNGQEIELYKVKPKVQYYPNERTDGNQSR